MLLFNLNIQNKYYKEGQEREKERRECSLHLHSQDIFLKDPSKVRFRNRGSLHDNHLEIGRYFVLVLSISPDRCLRKIPSCISPPPSRFSPESDLVDISRIQIILHCLKSPSPISYAKEKQSGIWSFMPFGFPLHCYSISFFLTSNGPTSHVIPSIPVLATWHFSNNKCWVFQ